MQDVTDPGLVLVKVGRIEAAPFVLAVSPSGELEGVRVRVLSAHHGLEGHVRTARPGDGGHLDPAPDL